MPHVRRSALSAIAILTAAFALPLAAQEAVAVDPSVVVSGMFYAGATVRVSAVVPRGVGVAMVCRNENRSLVLNRKGKALGLVWMNVGRVSFDSVPGLYLLRTSAPLERLAPAPELRAQGVGFGALGARRGAGSGPAGLFDELVRLEERDGVWRQSEGTVHVQPAEGDVALATTDFRLPPKTRPGAYEVLVYTFDGGRGSLVGSADLRLREGRVAAFITSLATRHGLVYGILAAVIAMAMGLLTGLVFGLGSKH